MLDELCGTAGLVCGEVSYYGGYVSQKATGLWRFARKIPIGSAGQWIITLPVRLLPVISFDRSLTRTIGWPFYSICLEAYKPRFSGPLSDRAFRHEGDPSRT